MSTSTPQLRGEPAPRSSALSDEWQGTKALLLDAAEAHFAERGFEGTSMRAVTRDAGVGLSAANYHFGSKEALIHAALLRRIEPLNRRRLERLDALEQATPGAPVSLEALVDAYVRPGFEEQAAVDDGGRVFRQIAARLSSDPHEAVASLKTALFQPVGLRFMDALARALPERSPEQLRMDFHFMLGMTLHTLMGNIHREFEHSGLGAKLDEEVLLGRLVAFAVAGFRSGCSDGMSGISEEER